MKSFKRYLLPLLIFFSVWIFHYIWLVYFPEADDIQLQWASVGPNSASGLFKSYINSKSYFLGYTYALSFVFAYINYRKYRENNLCSTSKLPLISSLGLTGVLSIGGCFVIGCCGSPMLAVYLTWFGASFVPLAKPLIAILSTLLIIGMALFNRKKEILTVTNQSKNCDCE